MSLVDFDADKTSCSPPAPRLPIRYLNLVGDRYLELVDAPGSTQLLPAGSQIPIDRTAPALDLDLLLGGLKPVIQGLNPQDVNALSASLLQILQGQGGTLESLFSKTSSFSNALADNNQVIEQLIDNLKTIAGHARRGRRPVLRRDRQARATGAAASRRTATRSAPPSRRSTTAPRRWPTCSAGTAAAGRHGRPAEPARADYLDADKATFDATLQRLPDNYRKLARVGSYGAFFQYYICGITFRVSDLQGRTVQFPWIRQETGRCAGRMIKYRGSNLIRAGFIGVVLVILVIAVGLQPERLMSWATSLRYQALFAEAGGLIVGNDVTVAGIKVGSVTSSRTRQRRCAGRFHDRR